MTTMTAATAIMLSATTLMSQLTAPDAPSATATPPPEAPKPTPMAATPQSKQKKTEQTAAMAGAGQMTPQSTLLSGNEKRSVLGG